MSNTSRSAHGACKCSRDVHGVLSGHSVIVGPQCFRAPGCCSFCLSRAHHQRVRSRASCSGEDSATQLCKTHGKSLCNEFRSCLRQIDLFVCGWFPFKPKQSNQTLTHVWSRSQKVVHFCPDLNEALDWSALVGSRQSAQGDKDAYMNSRQMSGRFIEAPAAHKELSTSN